MIVQPSKTVIRDVSNSLKNLLSSKIAGLEEGNISFQSPADFTPPGAKSLSQFLFQVKVNPHGRNSLPAPAGLDDGGSSLSELRNPPVPVDLIYMLTPYGPDPIAEMELFESIITLLNDNSVLRDDLLDGTLAEQGNEEIRITPFDFGAEHLNNIWSIFPNKAYKVSLFYCLSPVMLMSEKVISEKRVTSRKMDLYKLEQ